MNAEELVKGIEHLVSLPDVCIKVNMMTDSPLYSAKDIGEVISQDTDLSARLLSLVNSAFYGMRAPVDTISRAVTVIGTKGLRNLVLVTSAAEIFTGIPADLVDMTEFWRYSVTTGVISKALSTQCNVLHGERLFVMGVLHDIGRLVIYLRLPEQSRDVLLIIGGNDAILADAEADVFGFTHMDAGAALLKTWKLPESLIAVAGTHHKPMNAGDYRLEASLVKIAGLLSQGEMSGEPLDEILDQVPPEVWQITGLDRESVTSVMEEVPARVAEVLNVVLSPNMPAEQRR
ncbi:phosphohydrolase [bacterium endosymbiont of Escarpia laminata]|nr:MAG: phosphohydrolase [bacterium endosymbiont of Escarpia laminata]RLJ18402.1 MAG: phosphohydrolase [bacterium endosymbiont of Escarpia laminata]